MQSLAQYIKSAQDNRLSGFFSLYPPLCEYIAQRHRQGDLVAAFSPEHVYVDLEAGEVEIHTAPEDIDRILPYISPEQTGSLSRGADQRSILYSLGVVFYEVLTGALPFYADDTLGWIYIHLSSTPQPPHTVNPEVPEVLSEVVMKLLAKSPDDRYHSVDALQADLARCHRQWQDTGSIEPFALGQADLYQHLLRRQELFGRDREMAVLAAAYREAKLGRSQAVLISGYPGVGKTALVNTFRTMINGDKGSFLYGKCPQIMGEVPYTPVLEAVKILIRQILSRSQTELEYWKRQIRSALGRQGAVLTELIPELASLTGGFPALRAAAPMESERRFRAAFTALIDVFVREDGPLIFFLDDIQWIDPASLELVTSLVQDVGGSMLFIGAYRSNTDWALSEVSSLTQNLIDGGATVRKLHLEALTPHDTEEMISSILGQADGIADLVVEVSRRSGGIPLYIKQLLLNLYSMGALIFSPDELVWQYTDSTGQLPGWSEDVVDLVLDRIKRVPAMTLEILKFAACLGRWFPLDILSAALKQPAGALIDYLQPAVELGILLRNSYAGIELADSSYEFTHDKVAEAVFSLLSEDEKTQAHLKAGRALLEARSSALDDHELFAAVDHLNHAVDLIDEPEQRLLLAEYNLKAAMRARASVAFQAALWYSEMGIKLLPTGHWDSHYELSFNLYSQHYWCKFLLEGFEAAEPIFQLLIEKACTVEDKVVLYNDKAALATGYYTDEEAVSSGLAALQLLGLTIPMRPSKQYLARELIHTWWMLRGKTAESLLSLPPMTNRWALQTISTLANLIPPATVFDPGLFACIVLQMTKVSLRYGNSAYSAFAFATYGFICATQLNALNQAASFQRVALILATQYGDSINYMVYYVLATYLNHWHKPLRENLSYGEQSYRLADEQGDVLFAGAIQVEMALIRYVLGDSLEALSRQTKAAKAANTRYGISDLLDILYTVDQYIDNLRGGTVSPTSFTGEGYNEDIVSARMLKTESGITVPFYYLMKIRSLYLHGAFEAAWELAATVYPERGAMVGKISQPEYAYLLCLTAAAVLPRLTGSQRRQAKRLMKRGLKQLRRWSKACEDNYLHRYKLASAEIHRIHGHRQRAIAAYEEAISLALVQGCTLDAAIACELAGKLYLEMGYDQNKQAHFDSASRLYEKYGAIVKAREMQEQYGAAAERLEHAAPTNEEAPHQRVRESGKDLGPSGRFHSLEAVEVAERIAERANLLALTEALESLSSRQDLYGVVERLMEIILERSGAERAYLLAALDENVAVIACKESGDKARVFPSSQWPGPAAARKTSAPIRGYSEGIIRYALHSGVPIIIDDTEKDPLFSQYSFDDGYKPRSILCLTLPAQGGPTPVLYLDNNLATHGFSEELTGFVRRLALLILQILATAGAALNPSQESTAAAAKEEPAPISLTDKEAAILSLMASGLSNAEIARRLQIAEGTVKWHTNRLFKKLEVENRTQAVVRAAELGLLELE